MNNCAEDIRHILEAGLDDSDSSSGGLGLVYAVNLFVDREPAKPINCVTIYNTEGRPPYLGLNCVGYEYPSVQIRVRNSDSNVAWALIEGIKDSLHGRHQQTWNGTLYSVIACSSGPALLEWDDNGNVILFINFEVQRRTA
jgi:hypothetical protein